MSFDYPNIDNPFVTLIFLAIWFLWYDNLCRVQRAQSDRMAQLIARLWHLKRLGN